MTDPKRSPKADPHPNVETVAYPYVDIDDEGIHLLYRLVKRIEFRKYGDNKGEKRPWFESFDGDGWVPGLNGVHRVPYNLPKLLRGIEAGETIWVVEGEKDVHTLMNLGVTATCNPGGAGKNLDTLDVIRDADKVRIVADQDPAGLDHAVKVYRRLKDHVDDVRIVHPRVGKDITDAWMALTGYPAEDLVDDPVEHWFYKLDRVEKRGKNQWTALCPAHDDHNPSLSIGLGDDGRKVLAFCHAGCTYGQIRSAMLKRGLPWFVLGDSGSAPTADDVDDDPADDDRDDGDEDEDDPLQYRMLSDISPKDVEWLWRFWLPLGMVSIFEGDPKVGKSTILADLMARVTTGRDMPDGSPGVKGGVVLVGAEDAIEEVIKPKAMAMGADDSRIAVVGLQRDENGDLVPISVPEDLRRLEKLVEKVGATLVIFDPINAYLTERTDYFKDPSVRRALTPLMETAANTGAAIVMVRHLRKDKRGMDAIGVGQGSVAFTGIARSVLLAGKHPDLAETFALVRSASNIAPPVSAHRYQLAQHQELAVAVVEWGEAEQLDPNAVVKGPDARRQSPRRDEAKEALRELLAEGPVPVRVLKEAAGKSGISWATWESAKDELGILSRKVMNETGFGVKEWLWELPSYMDKDGKIILGSMGTGERDEPG